MPDQNALNAYLQRGYHEISGWLLQPALDATLFLGRLQNEVGCQGAVCEIGVWEGRYLVPLSFLSAAPQRVLGIDPFIHSSDRTAQLKRLRQNLDSYARRPDLVHILETDSKQVTATQALGLLGAKCQFVSVDGDHTMEGALHDLRLAESLLAPYGIIALDDIPNFSCPGVTEAAIIHGLDPLAKTAPFLSVSNKLFLTQKENCAHFREVILAKARAGSVGEWADRVLKYHDRMTALDVPVRLMGQDLLVAA